MDSYITKSLTGLLLIINFVHGVSNAETFTPLQEPLIRDLRPKPNIMLVMDTSKAGVDSEIELTSTERDFFKKELTTLNLTGKAKITKTQAISVALLKNLETYQHIAHFGLAKVGESSPYGYITEGTGYYTASEVKDVNPIILPINTDYSGKDKDYVGNYSKLHAKEKDHLDALKKSIANFQQNYSSTTSLTRAWVYGLSEINKYFWGSRYYKDDSNRNFEAGKEKHIANKILPEDIGKGIMGEARIEYKTYEDPIRFICQQSHILYFPVEKSGAYDSVKNYDRIINIPINSYKIILNDDPSKFVLFDKKDKELNTLYTTHLQQYLATVSGLLKHYMTNYGSQRIKFNGKATLADLHGNSWMGWGTIVQKPGEGGGFEPGHSTTRGVYEPSDIHMSAIYTGTSFNIPADHVEWNEDLFTPGSTNFSLRSDSLQDFIAGYTRYRDHLPGSVNKYHTSLDSNDYHQNKKLTALSKSTEVYLRANRHKEPTLTSIYKRSKEYLDKVIVSYKTNGRFIKDQHVSAEEKKQDDVGGVFATDLEFEAGFSKESSRKTIQRIEYSVNHNEQFWTSEIRAYDPRKLLKSGNAIVNGSYYANSRTDPTWTTSETITYNQGKFFTSFNGGEQSLSTIVSGGKEKWLKGDLTLPTDKFRVRNVILGDIVNSSIVYEARDHFHINLDLVGDRKRYIEYMYKKRDHFENNLLIAGSNDGFLNFIIAGRNSENSAGKDLAGTRKAAYFIPFFKKDIKDIVEPLPWYGGSFEHKYRVDGQINIFDAIVDDGFKTTGIAGMGAGYKGLVGFELFSIDEGGNVDNKGDVRPLFEIDNKTSGFSNLGYTYSGFSFFNNSSDNGQSIAVFGNGPGNKNDVSSLFFINAITGELVGELELPAGKGGAFTPALVLAKDRLGQKIEKIYVGDYSGKLFKIDFSNTSSELSGQIKNAKVTILIDAATFDTDKAIEGISISVKPYVVRNSETGNDWVYFGTGMLATEKQRNSKVIQKFFGIEDRDMLVIPGYLPLNKLSLQLNEASKKEIGSTLGFNIATEHQTFLVRGINDAIAQRPSEKGWFIPLSVDVIDNILPASFSGKIGKRNSSSAHVIYPAARIVRDKIIFSVREVFEGNADNACASDVVQSTVFVLDLFTGASVIKGTVQNSIISNPAGATLSGLGVVAPFNTFGGLTADSYVGNIESGYNISLKRKERIRLDDVRSDSDIKNSNSSNIGGRLTKKYDFYMRNTGTSRIFFDEAGFWYPLVSYDHLPFSGMFGEEGTAVDNYLGPLVLEPEPKKKLTPRRLSIRKIF